MENGTNGSGCAMDGKYIYGIITSSNEAALDILGLGSSRPVYTFVHQGLGCVVSDYSGKDLGSMSKEEVIRCLLAHQVVVEQVMREHTVLPVKFGTFLASSEEVRDLLSQGHQRFVAALAWIQGKVEVEVAATWNREQVLGEIGREEEIVRARETVRGSPDGQTLEGRIRLGRLVKAFMDRRRDSYREQMIGFLQPVALDVQPNTLVSDQMVMNVAFLVEKAQKDEFESRVSQLNDLFHDQINFRIIGPLPPYSFATVEVSRLSPEGVEEARQLLRLGGDISEPEVRRAYRHLAAENHPDLKPGDELAMARFAKARQAFDLLTAYCRGQAESSGRFLINIRRWRDEEVQHLRFAEIGAVAGETDG